MRVLDLLDHELPLHSGCAFRTRAILKTHGLFAEPELWEARRNHGHVVANADHNGSSNVSRVEPIYRRLIEGGGVEA